MRTPSGVWENWAVDASGRKVDRGKKAASQSNHRSARRPPVWGKAESLASAWPLARPRLHCRVASGEAWHGSTRHRGRPQHPWALDAPGGCSLTARPTPATPPRLLLRQRAGQQPVAGLRLAVAHHVLRSVRKEEPHAGSRLTRHRRMASAVTVVTTHTPRAQHGGTHLAARPKSTPLHLSPLRAAVDSRHMTQCGGPVCKPLHPSMTAQGLPAAQQ